jgi:membrane associated rhomboid family serine protease
MLDGISAVLGALVVVMPCLSLENGNCPAALSAFGCGFAVMSLAFLDRRAPEPWRRWVSGVLGICVAVPPWVLQRALLPMDAVLAPPMTGLAVSMPVVLGVGIVVAAALDMVLTAMEDRRSISLGQATAPALKSVSYPVPAIL